MAKLTRLIHQIVIQLHLVAESCTICSSSSRQPVRKLLDTPSYTKTGHYKKTCWLPVNLYCFHSSLSVVLSRNIRTNLASVTGILTTHHFVLSLKIGSYLSWLLCSTAQRCQHVALSLSGAALHHSTVLIQCTIITKMTATILHKCVTKIPI
jgi:hypothetical protein